MIFFARFETVFTVLRWIFVLNVLVAPRVVCHRHTDISSQDTANQVLETHLERYHQRDPFRVDDDTVHFHLSFFNLLSEIPSGINIESCPVLAQQASSSNFNGLAGNILTSEFAPTAGNQFPSISITERGPATHFGTNSFRRIQLGVWIL